jgi:hypothetical protein
MIKRRSKAKKQAAARKKKTGSALFSEARGGNTN